MKSFLIIGMGEFGRHVANKLSEFDNEIWIVDQDKEKVNLLSKCFDNCFQGDCMQRETLEELKVTNFDVVIVTVGENFQASLEITSTLKELGAKYIIVKSYSEIQSKFLKMAGANETIYPEKESAEKLAVRTSSSNFINYYQLSEDVLMTEVGIFDSWIGRNLIEINPRKKYEINVIAVKRDNKIIMPNPSDPFLKGDHIFIFSDKEKMDKLSKMK